MTPEEMEICGGRVRFVVVRSVSVQRTYEDGDQEHDPDLRIEQNLLKLGPLEGVVLNTGLIDRHMLKQGTLLSLSQELRSHWGIWQDAHSRYADKHRHQSEDDEHNLPALKRSIWSDMLETERHESTNDLTESETAVPDRETRCLLRLGIPL